MIDAPTDTEWSAWTAAGEARTCRDCGARVHEDEGGVVADPRVPGSWLCERCMSGYEPCDHCMRASDPADLDDAGHCADCADELRSDRDHYRGAAS